MNLDYLIQLLTNRLSTLALAKDQAFQVGDLDKINTISAEIFDVESTLTKLKLMQTLEQTALATSNSFTDVVKNAVETTFTPTVINDATKCLLMYNIEPYATDPYHEIKIQTILEKMGFMDTIDQIDSYLKKSTPDTPLNGLMIYNSAAKYSVDARLMLALMELDSRFGTQGLGARTNNPGNVGNNGIDERTYSSWDAGVDAVANWLNNHRITISSENVIDNTVIEAVMIPAPQKNIDYTITPAASPVITIENIVIAPDMASGITSVATSTPMIDPVAIDISTSTTTEVVTSTPDLNTATTTETSISSESN